MRKKYDHQDIVFICRQVQTYSWNAAAVPAAGKVDARADDRYCLAVEDIPDLVHAVEAGMYAEDLGVHAVEAEMYAEDLGTLYSSAIQLGISEVDTASAIRQALSVESV